MLRDFEDRNNFDFIKQTIDTDVNNIWDDIYKPEQYKNSKPTDFFHFEYFMLPHKIYENDKFVEKCHQLRARFSVGVQDTLFPSNDSKNVPIDGLALFVNSTWEKIKT